MLAMNIAFFILLVGSCSYAAFFGGWEGKILSGMLLCGAFLTPAVVAMFEHAYGLPLVTFAVDLPLLLGIGVIALQTNRFWPIWIFAFHMLSVLTFVAWAMSPQERGVIFENTAAFWSIAIQLVLLFGPYLDRRAARNPVLMQHRRTSRISHPS